MGLSIALWVRAIELEVWACQWERSELILVQMRGNAWLTGLVKMILLCEVLALEPPEALQHLSDGAPPGGYMTPTPTFILKVKRVAATKKASLVYELTQHRLFLLLDCVCPPVSLGGLRAYHWCDRPGQRVQSFTMGMGEGGTS